MHTALHEIRELLENTFRSLGFSTADSSQLEDRANEFASATFVFSGAEVFKDSIEYASQIEPTWQKWITVGLIILGAVFFILYSLLAAFQPRLEYYSRFVPGSAS